MPLFSVVLGIRVLGLTAATAVDGARASTYGNDFSLFCSDRENCNLSQSYESTNEENESPDDIKSILSSYLIVQLIHNIKIIKNCFLKIGQRNGMIFLKSL